MPRKFVDAVNGLAPTDPCLPLVHTTTSPIFEYDIVPSEQLEPKECHVYRKEELAYLFYWFAVKSNCYYWADRNWKDFSCS